MTDKDFDDAGDGEIDLRALFGDDWETTATADADGDSGSDADSADISDADQQALRGLFAADVSNSPDSSVTVESILAAARAASAPKAAVPKTDFTDELARRRRLKIGKGLLAAAAVAAVVVGAATLLRGNGSSNTTSSNAAAAPASVTAASRAPGLAGGDSAAGGAGSAAAGASAEASSAGSTFAAGSGAASAAGSQGAAAAGGSSAASSSGSGSVSAAASAAAASSAAQSSGTGSSGAASSSGASSAGAASSGGGGSKHPIPAAGVTGGSSAAGTTASGESSGASGSASTCGWPQLPAGADAQAKATLGGVVEPHRTLIAGCAANRLQGGSFPAIGNLRLTVTVEVTKQAAGIHACVTPGCVPIGGGAYAIETAASTTIRLDGAGHQVVVRAPAALKIPRDHLLAFATAIDRLTR